MDALGEMDRDSVSQLPVMPGDQILGILGPDDVISFFKYIEHAQPAAKTIHWQDAVCIGINRAVNTLA